MGCRVVYSSRAGPGFDLEYAIMPLALDPARTAFPTSTEDFQLTIGALTGRILHDKPVSDEDLPG